ncbi:TetR/AcrR family transcriptional regulator [Cellulomonas iranensis]|uniref:AcrR family transcriptional regulator n=1 Tax=Cellulomonas iranensis TaxID=76862 RepID=A0ABU0GIS6_9CELL|nr:TetR/AcrR family transcriptional regulator [Cellulomonas iranensis]MDQ0425280.1 AcrR family transcriptional regulator [Cellulomonas iranensis]
MGRAPTFDADAVVRAARDVFWAHGYEDASLPALEAATGLSRSSIYHAFGSKRGLFDAAVASYLADVVRPRLRVLTADPVAPDALARYLRGLRDALTATGSAAAAHGCLLLNASGAPVAHDADVRATIAAYRDELRAGIGRGVDAAHPALPDDERARLAEACTALVVAALLVVRVDPDAAARSLDAALGLAA